MLMLARCPCSDTRCRGTAPQHSLVSAPSLTTPGSTAICPAGRTCGFSPRPASRPRGTASGRYWSESAWLTAPTTGSRRTRWARGSALGAPAAGGGVRGRGGAPPCLLGDPELLILDEPMNGLDPAGIAGMRDLILSLVAEGRTVVLSSHLLDEVERTCDAVAIVDRGSIIRQGPISELLAGALVAVQVECSEPGRARALLAGTTLGARVEAGPAALGLEITLPAGTGRDVIAEINRVLVAGGISVYRLQPVQASLESWFLQVTSRLGDPE